MEHREIVTYNYINVDRCLQIWGVLLGVLLLVCGIIGLVEEGPLNPAFSFPQGIGSSVTITNNNQNIWNPSQVMITVGQSVSWSWSSTHDVAQTNPGSTTPISGGFNSGNPAASSSYSNQFNQQGTYGFVCTVHNEQGTVTVAPKPGAFQNGGWVGDENLMWTFAVLCALLIIIGFVIILAELWVGFILGWFTLFLSFLSKGVFYILLGLLVLGVAGVLGFITGLLFMILGVVLIFLGRNSFRYVTDREYFTRRGGTVITTRETVSRV